MYLEINSGAHQVEYLTVQQCLTCKHQARLILCKLSYLLVWASMTKGEKHIYLLQNEHKW